VDESKKLSKDIWKDKKKGISLQPLSKESHQPETGDDRLRGWREGRKKGRKNFKKVLEDLKRRLPLPPQKAKTSSLKLMGKEEERKPVMSKRKKSVKTDSLGNLARKNKIEKRSKNFWMIEKAS
jgi:hypothetical protein